MAPALLSERYTCAHGGRRWLLLVLGVLWLAAVWAAGFEVLQAETRLEQGVYRLDARIVYRFGEAPREALHSGVPLTVVLEIEVLRRREWLWDETVAALEQIFLLEYHSLSRQYVVTNANSGERKSFPNLPAAARYMGHIDDFPLLDASLLESGERYYIQLRADLDIDSLPVPLQLVAYLSDDWDLTSPWYAWPL